MIERAAAERAFRAAVAACDPEARVAAALREGDGDGDGDGEGIGTGTGVGPGPGVGTGTGPGISTGTGTGSGPGTGTGTGSGPGTGTGTGTGSGSGPGIGTGTGTGTGTGIGIGTGAGAGAGERRRFGIAVGKAALAMARGAGEVARGVVVTVDGAPGEAPRGWRVVRAGHPMPDARSVAAAAEVRALVAGAGEGDVVLALISGGASALIEEPRVPLAELVAITRAVMAAGAPIAALNAVRGALSAIKAGQLARACAAPIVTLVASDVIGDPLDVIGSGPTIAGAPAEARRAAAIAILRDHGVAVPASLARPVIEAAEAPGVRARDRAELVLPMAAFADALAAALGVRRLDPPLAGDALAAADRLAAEPGALVAWGEPTVRLPDDPGTGGRAQQLALALACRLRGTERAALVAGTDGVDGPAPPGRAAPAGAYVDGTTWDRIAAAGLDPAAALARCDAGPALAAAGALVVTGPTGVNHADVVVLG